MRISQGNTWHLVSRSVGTQVPQPSFMTLAPLWYTEPNSPELTHRTKNSALARPALVWLRAMPSSSGWLRVSSGRFT